MKHPKYGYEQHPKTLEEVAASAFAYMALPKSEQTYANGVTLTSEAFTDLATRLLQLERMVAEVPAMVRGLVRAERAA